MESVAANQATCPGPMPGRLESLEQQGVHALRAGHDGWAERLFRSAIELAPLQAHLHCNLGLTLKNQGRLEEAAASLAKAVELSPTSALMRNNLGTVLERLGKIPEAKAAYQQALALDPGYAIAVFNLGNTCQADGQSELAAAHYRQAARLQPDFADAWAALGHLLLRSGDSAEAQIALSRAIELRPRDAQFHRALADCLHQQHLLAQAVQSYEHAVAIDERCVEAWYAMGCAQLTMGEYAAAIRSFQSCLHIVPEAAEAHYNLAVACFKIGQVEQAIEHARRAESLNPELLGKSARETIAVIIPGSSSAHNQTILDARRTWGDECLLTSPADHPPQRRIARDRTRIGYVSAFFHRANWMKPVWGLINKHDRSQFEIHLFSEKAQAGFESGYEAHATDRFHHLGGLSNEQAAELIRSCELDLLVDLNGYSYMPRLPLFGARPAPVIVGWFNMFATTGLSCFDYLIGDDQVIRAEEQQFYTEKILRVPGSYLAFEVNYPVPDVVPPPCLTHDRITFGCLASQYKIAPQVLAAWCEIVRQCPGSRLVLKNADLDSELTRSYLLEQIGACGIDPSRVELSGRAAHYQFLEKYNEIDLALDTFPYNGGTTTMEAMWQGVPVLTFSGDRWASRTSASLLRAGNLSQYVAADLDGFVQLAVDLAHDPQSPRRLEELRMSMRERLKNSPVCDSTALARAMEELYLRLTR